MNTNRSFPWWGVALGIGCVGLLCIGILGVGGLAYFSVQKSSTQLAPEAVSTIPLLLTQAASSSAIPLLPEPTSSRSALTGSQQVDEDRLYDDFSSDALGWPVYDDGKTILKYEEGQYSLQVIEKDYYDWAYLPVDFNPVELWFDMKGAAGAHPQDGTAGVFCQYRDEDNYYYVEFDLGEGSYVIGQYVGGKDIPLTPQNDAGQYWQTADNFNTSPEAVNRIGVSCYPDTIVLVINSDWIKEVSTQAPLDKLGKAAFFVYSYPYAGKEGYKVYFDNVEAYKSVQ